MFKNLVKIYNNATCNLCDDPLDDGSSYCGTAIYMTINNKTDVYQEQNFEIAKSYHYFIDLLKNEFNNDFIEKHINPNMIYFDYEYKIISEIPLIVEIYNTDGYGLREINYDFPKAEEIFIVLKSKLLLDHKNIEYLKSNYKEINFICDDEFIKYDRNIYSDPNNELRGHLQKLNTIFGKGHEFLKFEIYDKKVDKGNVIIDYGKYDFHLKEYIIERKKNDFTLYKFIDFSAGFSAGIRIFRDSEEYDFVVWDNDVHFPDFYEDDKLYLMDSMGNNFKLDVQKEKNKLKGTFSGYISNNEESPKKVKIENGEFLIILTK